MKTELPLGIRIRGKSYVAYLTDKKGRPILKAVGKVGCITPKQADQERTILEKKIFDGTYEPKRKRALPVPVVPVYTVANLWPGYLTNYLNEGGRDAGRQEISWNHLKPTFGAVPVAEVTTDLIQSYIAARRSQNIQGGTINRELSVLKAMFTLGTESTGVGVKPKVDRIPFFPKKLEEGEPRQGFIKDAQYEVLMANAKAPWLRAFIECAYAFGFRKSELLNLHVDQCDLLERWIRLSGKDTKNRKPRKVKMTAKVYEALCVCVRGKKEEDFIFTREDGSHVVDPRQDWYDLCVASGLGKFVPAKTKDGEEDYKKFVGLNMHDFRRSAIRNMVRRGISDTVAMLISGHTTRNVFDRYNISSEEDLEQASLLLEGAFSGPKPIQKPLQGISRNQSITVSH